MTADLKPYPTYRDSGVEWLGEVPEGWRVHRMKTLFRETNERGRPDEPLLAATQTQGVIRKDSYEHRTVEALTNLESLKFVDVDDFVISLRSFQGGVERARAAGIISPAYTVLRAVPPASPEYLAALLKSRSFIDGLRVYVTGIREGQNIDYSKLGRSGLPVPPAEDQAAIVRYLDHIDSRIQRFVAAKERLIELLEEEKRSIAHRALTRGLEPDARLVPSGIDWLGGVPEHWRKLPLKRIARFRGGAGFPIEEQGDRAGELPFVKVSDMNSPGNETMIRDAVNRVTVESARRLNAHVFPAGTVVFPKVGGALLTNKRRVLAQPSCIDNNVMGCIIKPGVDERFVLALLRLIDLGLFVKPGPVPAIGEGDVRAIQIALPPLPEQKSIASYVGRAEAVPEAVIARARRHIALLREYRTRLVSDVVTGGLDVREAARKLLDDSSVPAQDGQPVEAAA